MPGVLVKPPKLWIHYSGIFDYNVMYNAMAKWFKERRYWFQETVYKHKPGNEFGKEEELKWNGNKKITDFYWFDIDVYFHIWDLNLVEVIKDGKKKKMYKARAQITIAGSVVMDYQGRWAKTRFVKWLGDLYIKYVLQTEQLVSYYHDELYYRMYKLHQVIKDSLNMAAKGHEYKRYMADNY